MEEKAEQLAERWGDGFRDHFTGAIVAKEGAPRYLNVEMLKYIIKKAYIKGYEEAKQ